MQARTIDSATRLDWMDWAKAIAIYIVVFGHLGSPLMRYIFCFHMAFFIMLSGFLQKKRSPLEELKRSAYSLLVPYLIYNAYLLVYSWFTGEFNSDYTLMMATGRQWFLSMACRPMWFLLCLFIMRMVYSLTGWKWSCVVAVACMALTFFGRKLGFMKPELDWYQYCTAIICFPFFTLGILVKRFNLHKLLDSVNRWVRAALMVLVFALGVFIASKNGFVNIFRLSPGNNALLFYLSASLMAVSLMEIIYSLLDIRCGYIQLVSEGTLLIFAVHQSILWPMHNILSSGNMAISALVAVATVLVLSGLAWCARKWCPVLLGK